LGNPTQQGKVFVATNFDWNDPNIHLLTTVSSSEIGLAFETLKTNYKNIFSEDELKRRTIFWIASNTLTDLGFED